MKIVLQEFENDNISIQSLVIPNRPLQTPEEWHYEIKKRLRDLRLGK